mmetsp:Transcript_2911/g.5238  ORF Transcript_2911/g.5238 Transcript_2911/m.5238 type:complete len:1085 (+) Transcript_2911:1-3255(+)
MARSIPVTQNLEVSKFLVDEATKSEWQVQGLPTDELSIQNGIMVSLSLRWPVLVDPQGQGLHWLKTKEEKNLLRVTNLNDKQFRTHLEDCLAFGKPLLIENIEEELDPVLDPVLEKLIQKSGRGYKIVLADKEVDFNERFALYMTTRLPNPHFSPEFSAKVTIIDFTVTSKGLEDQLLGRVVEKEKAELEQTRHALLQEVSMNKKKIKDLEDDLLFRLSSSAGNLLDDVSLVEVLATTKTTAQEVTEKLVIAVETERKLVTAREEYRGVAKRGAILYFVISEMTSVNNMYQTSLAQFLLLFDHSIASSDKAAALARRISNIVDFLTYCTWTYVTRGLFEKHRVLFSLLLALKIQLAERNTISHSDFNAFLKGGASLDIKDVRKKPHTWLPDQAWLNVVSLQGREPFEDLPDSIFQNEGPWKAWYDSDKPESVPSPLPFPDTESTRFHKLMLVRALREDRTVLAAQDYVEGVLGKRYSEAVTLNLDSAWAESNARQPLICLLSSGSDPTADIMELARKKKKAYASISMGQGQELQARRLIANGMAHGQWVLLANCHLGLKFMAEVENTLLKSEEVDPEFRLWITTEPHLKFPIGLLQMAIKITGEPPQGIKAGLKRSFQWVTQDMLDSVNRFEWRCLLYAICFMHSVVLERRKFGSLGWNIPYEFNQSDLEASLRFMQKHMNVVDSKKLSISWPTVRYMVSDIQYGGRVTDDMDRKLLNAYAETYLSPRIFDPEFSFFAGYRVPQGSEISKFRAEVETLPGVDHPDIFGLHVNADLTYRRNEAAAILSTIIETQPKGASSGTGGSGISREEAVVKIAEDLLSKMPSDFNQDYVKARISKQGGLARPLNVFLGQEINRLQAVIVHVRKTLKDLKFAIAGTIVMSPELQDLLNALFDARVPQAWLKMSWPSPTVGLWFAAFLRRVEQLTLWCNQGRPLSYWLAGFFNPQGFLTAIKQEVTRAHVGWALDDVVFSTEITKMDRDDVQNFPSEGVYVNGLFLEGAAWDRKQGCLVDAPPKILCSPLPIMYVSAITLAEKRTDSSSHYECPVYKLPKRGGSDVVFSVEVPVVDAPSRWILRGAAIICCKE